VPKARSHAVLRLLAHAIGIGIEAADILMHEVLTRTCEIDAQR
jgi:hypothetical protein